MVERVTQSYGPDELTRMGAALGAMANLREEETLSLCREILEAAFPDSLGHDVIHVLLHAKEPLHLIDIAVRCGQQKRAILPNGNLRTIMDKLVKCGILVNLGPPEKPRLILNQSDTRVQILRRMYGSMKFESQFQPV